MHFSTTWYGPNLRLAPHARDVDYLSLVLGGSYEEEVGSTRLECLPLSVRLHPAGEEHAHRFGAAGARCFNLELPRSWHVDVTGVTAALNRPVVVEPLSCANAAILPLLARAHEADVTILEDLAIALLTQCRRIAALEQAPVRNRGIRRAIDRINDEVSHPLSLTQLALEANLHPTHFARSFKALTGHTVGQYIRLRRCAYAQRLLANPKMSISRVAVASGFADHAHFARTLRTVTGLSPTQYRLLLRNG